MAERLLAESGPLSQFSEQPGLVRALALLDDVLEKARGQVNALLGQSSDKLGLRILCLVPADWNPAHFPVMRNWLGHYWPEVDAARREITLVPVANEVDALKQLDEIILCANRESSGNELFLMVGAVSAVDEQIVESWAASKRLFSARHQDRVIPGEGLSPCSSPTRVWLNGSPCRKRR